MPLNPTASFGKPPGLRASIFWLPRVASDLVQPEALAGVDPM